MEVLKSGQKTLILENKSPIAAEFHCFTKNSPSIFKPQVKSGTIPKNSEYRIQVDCYPDDVKKFTDVLYFIISEGDEIDINLSVEAYGDTIKAGGRDLSLIEVGTYYTYKTWTEEIYVENKGARDQTLYWTRKTNKGTPAEDLKGDAKDKGKKLTEEEAAELEKLSYVFVVVPS